MTAASSDALALRLDEVRYDGEQGPCLETLHSGLVTEVTDLAIESRWGPYPTLAMDLGVRSSLSLPLTVDSEIRGALNLYATAPDGFDGIKRQVAEVFALQTTAAMTVIIRQAQQVQVTDQLRDALASRAVIGQAIGILMVQRDVMADEAFAILRRDSQHQNRKLREIAAETISATTGHDPHETRFNDPE
ncbi:MAG: GAF and ANTAR domain-containing protein [Nocardioidaceae bacterium]